MAGAYHGRPVALTTKHGKERAVARPLAAGLGARVFVPNGIDTDLLGTFTGEVERPGPPREVAVRKARLGMARAGTALGVASEGSFGPHPHAPFVAGNQEILAFVDDDLGLVVTEGVLTTRTNFAHRKVSSFKELPDFLRGVGFPSHAVVARPDSVPDIVPDTSRAPEAIEKGITTLVVLRSAVERCRALSENGLVHVETDMRAHANPTRMRVIRRAAVKLARRLRTPCPECAAPGWGVVDVRAGLPCRLCDQPTELVGAEVHGCPLCDHRRELPRADGERAADPADCPLCNP